MAALRLIPTVDSMRVQKSLLQLKELKAQEADKYSKFRPNNNRGGQGSSDKFNRYIEQAEAVVESLQQLSNSLRRAKMSGQEAQQLPPSLDFLFNGLIDMIALPNTVQIGDRMQGFF